MSSGGPGGVFRRIFAHSLVFTITSGVMECLSQSSSMSLEEVFVLSRGLACREVWEPLKAWIERTLIFWRW